MENCFYCGSSEHPSSECVQKRDIQDIPPDAINLLGYSSTAEITELISRHQDGVINLASRAIYELSYEFRREYDEKLWQQERVDNLLDYVISITRGYVNIESDQPERAFNEFSEALSLAPNELYQTRARLLKSQAQYVLGDIDGAIKTITEAIEDAIILPDDLPDEEEKPIRPINSLYDYRLAAYYAAKGESETSLHYLCPLIKGYDNLEGDRLYFIKTRIDQHFDNISSQVDLLLGDLLEEKKSLATSAIEAAEVAIDNAKEWAVDTEPADTSLEQAKQKYNTDSYFGYLEAVQPGQNARESAAEAEKTQRINLHQNASQAVEKAQSAIERIVTDLDNLRTPAKQLGLPYEPHERVQMAQESLAVANDNFALDNYSGYLLAEEKATEASEMLSEMQSKATEFLQLEEDADTAIVDARVALQMYSSQLSEIYKTDEMLEKLNLAQTTLEEAIQAKKSYSKEGYARAIDKVQAIHKLIDEMTREVELKNLHEAVMKDIESVAIVLQNIETQSPEKFKTDKLEYAQSQLEEARAYVEAKTEEGYQKAMAETRQVNQLADEIKQDVELQNPREIAQREIETAAASMLELRTQHEGRFDPYKSNTAQAKLEEARAMITAPGELSINKSQQAIEKAGEAQGAIEQLVFGAEEESDRRSRDRKTCIAMASSTLLLGTGGWFIEPIVSVACALTGIACCCAPFLINWMERKRKGEN